jgi:hypothetical protein
MTATTENTLPAWQHTWREGMVPILELCHLEALERGLITDDKTLIQGGTTMPPPLQACADWPVEAACGISYMGWKGDSLKTVEDVESFFANFCAAIDKQMGEPAACRYFLNWFDETPREDMIALLLSEVRLAIALKREVRS